MEAPSELPVANRLLFLEKVRQSNAACQSGDFKNAVSLYSEALQISPGHPVLLSNRSAARVKLGDFQVWIKFIFINLSIFRNEDHIITSFCSKKYFINRIKLTMVKYCIFIYNIKKIVLHMQFILNSSLII